MPPCHAARLRPAPGALPARRPPSPRAPGEPRPHARFQESLWDLAPLEQPWAIPPLLFTVLETECHVSGAALLTFHAHGDDPGVRAVCVGGQAAVSARILSGHPQPLRPGRAFPGAAHLRGGATPGGAGQRSSLRAFQPRLVTWAGRFIHLRWRCKTATGLWGDGGSGSGRGRDPERSLPSARLGLAHTPRSR